MIKQNRKVVCEVSEGDYSADIEFSAKKDAGKVSFSRKIRIEGDGDDGAYEEKVLKIEMSWHDLNDYRGMSCSFDPGQGTRPYLIKFFRAIAEELERGK